MRMTIAINMDNAAFDESACDEAARILQDLSEKLAGADFNEPFDSKLRLQDSNGNPVGQMEVER